MSRYAMCPDCGRRMRRYRDLSGSWDGQSYVCDYCADDDYYEDDDYCVDENSFCRQCGNYDHYPDCLSFCGIFDD